MENTGDIFTDAIDRIYPANIANYIKSLYDNINTFYYMGILKNIDLSEFDTTLINLCTTDDYRDSELQFYIRDYIIKFTISTFKENGLSIVNDEDIMNIKVLCDIVNALCLYINDEISEPIPTEEVNEEELYESICSILSMYSTMNIIEARELINDVSVSFCDTLNLYLKTNISTNEIDEDFVFDIIGKITDKDNTLVGTKLINELMAGNISNLTLNFKEDQKTLLKCINMCKTANESVNELYAYLLLIGIEKNAMLKFLEENFNYENVSFIKSSNDKKFEYIKLLENRIKS